MCKPFLSPIVLKHSSLSLSLSFLCFMLDYVPATFDELLLLNDDAKTSIKKAISRRSFRLRTRYGTYEQYCRYATVRAKIRVVRSYL